MIHSAPFQTMGGSKQEGLILDLKVLAIIYQTNVETSTSWAQESSYDNAFVGFMKLFVLLKYQSKKYPVLVNVVAETSII